MLPLRHLKARPVLQLHPCMTQRMTSRIFVVCSIKSTKNGPTPNPSMEKTCQPSPVSMSVRIFFWKLTETRKLGKYIALIDYRIRFDELPLRSHGQIISYMSDYLSEVFQTTGAANVLFGAGNDGTTSSILTSRWQTFVSSLVLSSAPIYHIKFDPEHFPTPPRLGCDSLRMEYHTRM